LCTSNFDPSNDLDFRTAEQPQNPPKCDLQLKSKSAEYIGFEIKITHHKKDFKSPFQKP